MFGPLAQITKLLADAPRMAREMKAMHTRLAQSRFVGDAGAGQVRATVNGQGEVLGVQFEPALLQGGDAELIGELACAAVNAGCQMAREATQREMQQITGGLDLGALGGMLGGQP
jgi:hypothetical protein